MDRRAGACTKVEQLSRFNGASRRWCRGMGPVLASTCRSSRTRLQWGHDRWCPVEWLRIPSRMVTGSRRSFNGATTMVSWNGPRPGRDAVAHCSPASMGPRRWCRGMALDSDVAIRHRSRRSAASRFNGATTMVSWNGFSIMSMPRVKSWLQWGSFINCTHCMASMGPRRCCRGMAAATVRDGGPGGRFQWGHDDGVVEWPSLIFHAAPRDQVSFNGATTMVSWERREYASRKRLNPGIAAASMGPRRWCRGMEIFGTVDHLVDRPPAQGFDWGHDDGVVEWTDRLQTGRRLL